VNFALQWLVTQYAQPWRAYHNVSHVERMFRIWQGVAQTVAVIDPIGMALAIWFHDAVYDPKRHDNEEQSAEEAEHQFARLGIDEARIGSIRRMILVCFRLDAFNT
jgi:predicted metal-dependent HD superfamily phosphohydrolase